MFTHQMKIHFHTFPRHCATFCRSSHRGRDMSGYVKIRTGKSQSDTIFNMR